jgi:hypothetical protein
MSHTVSTAQTSTARSSERRNTATQLVEANVPAGSWIDVRPAASASASDAS